MKRIVWPLIVFHVPLPAGETGGRFGPSTLPIGFENVSSIAVCGVIWVPGAGVATAAVVAPVGNQLMTVGGELSQLRICAATQRVPASAVRRSLIVPSGL